MTAADHGGLLLVHAHPDDETFSTGGLIARSVAEGRRVDLVTCTGGEEGEIHDPDLDPEEAQPRLREIRREELECSLKALTAHSPGETHIAEAAPDGTTRHRPRPRGTLSLHLLGYRDSGMMGTESNNRPEAFWQAELDEAIGRLVGIVRQTRPAVMVSYDSNGNYGHPDHINAHRIAVGAWDAAADPARYPEAGAAHAVAKLYETAFNREAFLGLMLEMHGRGVELPWDFGKALTRAKEAASAYGMADLNPTNAEAIRQVAAALAEGEDPNAAWGLPEDEITARVDVSAYIGQKRASMDCHRTQRQDFGWLLAMPEDLLNRAIATEWFVLTRWRNREIPATHRETSLFAEL